MKRMFIVFLCLFIAFTSFACGAGRYSSDIYGDPDYEEDYEITSYVGSVNSDKYHDPDCEWAQKIKPENEIWFDSIEDAEDNGYHACKVCRP